MVFRICDITLFLILMDEVAAYCAAGDYPFLILLIWMLLMVLVGLGLDVEVVVIAAAARFNNSFSSSLAPISGRKDLKCRLTKFLKR